MMRTATLKIGERVMARWPGSAKFYPAKILKQDDEEMEVEFDEGTIYTIPVQHVKSKAAFRPKSKSKSPPRTTRARKSPGRPPGKASGRSRSRSPKRSQSQRSSYATRASEPALLEKSEARPSLRMRARAKQVDKTPPTRSSARIADQHPDYMARTEELLPSSGESDAEADPAESKKWKIPWKKIGITCFLLILMPSLAALILWLNMICGKSDCSVRLPKLKWNIGSYITVEAVALYGGFFLFQSLLTMMPIGKVVEGMMMDDGSCLKYRLNGFYSLISTVAAVAAVGACGLPLNYPIRHNVAFVSAAVLCTVLISSYLFLRGRKTLSGHQEKLKRERNVVEQFFMGCELNPRLGQVDFKMLLDGRMRMNLWALVIVCYVWEHVKEQVLSPSLLMLCSLQMAYVAHWQWYEELMLSTWEFKNEATGFMLAFGSLALTPFVFTISVRYLLFHRTEMNPAYLVAAFALFSVGYIILRKANNQKDEFKRDPYHPKFIMMRTICTDKSQKILADGWWRFVRHPNYLGDLLMAMAFSLLCGFQHVIPHTYFLYLLAYLIIRIVRVERQCRSQYGSQWTEYCEKVKYRMVPYVF